MSKRKPNFEKRSTALFLALGIIFLFAVAYLASRPLIFTTRTAFTADIGMEIPSDWDHKTFPFEPEEKKLVQYDVTPVAIICSKSCAKTQKENDVYMTLTVDPTPYESSQVAAESRFSTLKRIPQLQDLALSKMMVSGREIFLISNSTEEFLIRTYIFEHNSHIYVLDIKILRRPDLAIVSKFNEFVVQSMVKRLSFN